MREVVIVSAARTPMGKFLGKLAGFTAPELGALAIEECLKRSGIDKHTVEEVIMGNVVSAGIGQAPARQAALKAGLPSTVSALTINKVCGSGLKAVVLAAQAIKAGDADIVIAGGMESMSQVPFYAKDIRNGYKMGNQSLIDGAIHDGLIDAYSQEHMGSFGDYTAKKANVTREEQDIYAANSHRKAVAAQALLKEEIVPVEIKDRKGTVLEIMDTDESPRPDSSVEKLEKLKPAFNKDGSVTAGNAPGLNDGSAAILVMSREKANALKLKPLARITGYATSGTDPKDVFFAPAEAIRMVTKKIGADGPDHFDLFEINEAFSTQALANCKELGIDLGKVNVNGGAVALGHPIGASGSRVLVTLLYEMKRRNAKTGCAALCLGGGNAVAMAIENLN